MATIGLYFGSFNPIHIGHLLVATHIREAAGLEEVWFIVSPQNPFKQHLKLADDQHRLEMVRISTEFVPYFKAVDIEFRLPKPSYTHLTLKELMKEFPEQNFQLIIGEDNSAKFHEWKEAGWIHENLPILIYNRSNSTSASKIPNSTLYHLPLIDISSTEIRKRVQNKLPITWFVPDNVEQYIRFHKLYQ